MTLSFVETANFTDVVEEYFGTDEHYMKLQAALLRNPEAGSVIPGTGGLAKHVGPILGEGKGREADSG